MGKAWPRNRTQVAAGEEGSTPEDGHDLRLRRRWRLPRQVLSVNKNGRKRADDRSTEDVGRNTSACVKKSLSFKRRTHRAGVLDATMTSLTCASTRTDCY